MEITAKRPWLSSLGDVPATLEYFHGSMVDMVEDAAKKYPDYIAFDFMGRSTTYREMVANIEKCARSLRTIGVRQNDRVTIAMPNCPQAIYMFYAVNMIGAVANMVHPLSSEKELEFYINESESVTVVTLDQFYHKFEAIRENTCVVNIVIARIRDALSRPLRMGYMLTEGRKIKKIPEDAPVILWDEFMRLGKACFWNYKVKRGDDDPAVILYSGGTTGTTKGILLTNLNFNALGEQVFATNPMYRPGATRCSRPCRCSTASASACASTPCSRTAGAAYWCRASRPRAIPSSSPSTAATSSRACRRCTRRCCACRTWTGPI